MSNQRIDRVESQLGQLQEAMVMIARSDEKLIYVVEKLKDHDKRIADLEENQKAVDDNTRAVRTIQRLTWMAVSGVFAFILFLIRREFQ